MKKSRGFTLIELLGVITLLGLIIAIIIPKANASIEKARQNSAADNGLSYIKATRDYYNANILDSDFALKDGKNYVSKFDSYIDVDGDRPLSGYITISDDKIVYAKLCVNYYEVIYQNSDAIVSGTCTGEEEASQYTSFVAGAAKAYIYVTPGSFNTESNINHFDCSPYTLIVYVDANEKVLKTYLGYVFDNIDVSTIENYKTSLATNFSNMSGHDFGATHYYILEELTPIYFFEYNEYISHTGAPFGLVDYSQSVESVVNNILSVPIGSTISNTVYKTIEF